MKLEVGRVAKAHGLRGEVAVQPISDRSERFAPGSILESENGDSFTIFASRFANGQYLIQFEGVTDRTGAESLRGTLLFADSLPAEPGELWAYEVVGSEVRNSDGTVIGTVDHLQPSPAHDQLVLNNGALIPAVFIVRASDGVVEVEIPEGLLDL